MTVDLVASGLVVDAHTDAAQVAQVAQDTVRHKTLASGPYKWVTLSSDGWPLGHWDDSHRLPSGVEPGGAVYVEVSAIERLAG